MPAIPFSQCKYSAFFSYAHADDEAWRDWVTLFSDEFEKGMASFLHGIRLPRVHLSGENGPVNGPLDGALRSNIEQSFAMIVFVHDNYLQSEWCLQEIRHFKTLFGEEGFRDRLFIVAMSRSAIEALGGRPTWRALFPNNDQVWMRFFQDGAEDEPVNIYAATRKARMIVDNDFWDQFKRLRGQLAATIKASVAAEQQTRTYPGTEVGESVVIDPRTVHVYIESSPELADFNASMGQQVLATWEQVMALEKEEPPLRLRPTGLPLDSLQDRPALDDANGVILLWSQKTPDSMMAQINLVEPKLSGPHFAPGVIAYLMGDASDQPPAPELNHWPVVRFMTRADGSTTVVADDAPLLARFLRDVLRHKRGG